MSRSLNKVTLIGNLGADPEVRSTSNGVAGGHTVAGHVAPVEEPERGKAGKDGVAPRHPVEQQGVEPRRSRRAVLQEGRQALRRGEHRVSVVAGSRGPDPVHHGDHGPRGDPAERQGDGSETYTPSAKVLPRRQPRPRARTSLSRTSPRHSTRKTTTCRSDPRRSTPPADAGGGRGTAAPRPGPWGVASSSGGARRRGAGRGASPLGTLQ